MNPKEKAFVNEYIINGGNAYQAALKAGYARSTAKNAADWLNETMRNDDTKRRLPYKPYLREAIDERLKEIEDAYKQWLANLDGKKTNKFRRRS